jgi:uncharacterized membrane protein
MSKQKYWRIDIFPFCICFFFFTLYTTLSIVRHLHYGSFGFDLGIADQIVWLYSRFKAPITTIQFYTFTSLLTDHLEFIYILLAPFYWLYNSVITLLIIQAFFVSFSGIPIYLLAKRKNIDHWVSNSLLFSYLLFFGIQNAIWFDVHSLAFGASLLAWFIYFLDKGNAKWTLLTLVLTFLCKEDMALLTLLIGLIYFFYGNKKIASYIISISVIYLFVVFAVYFPYFTHDGYRYAGKSGIFSDLKLSYLYDSANKINILFYSISWFGFLPILSPIFLIPAFGDISHYFIFGHLVSGAQVIFGHYQVALAPLLVLPTIVVIGRSKILNNKYLVLYICILAIVFQYTLHLPLSYLTKSWFWQTPSSVKNINNIIRYIPENESVVSQNNITAHLSHRNDIFTLWPSKKTFPHVTLCGKTVCNWFRWAGKPNYLVVDTGENWDIRHLLSNRDDYINGLNNLEVSGIIRKYHQEGNATLYKILKQP